MVIDTVDDVVIGDIGGEIVNTGGVAVRPFWWSTECVAALGYGSEGAAGTTGSDEVSSTTSATTAAGTEATGATTNETGSGGGGSGTGDGSGGVGAGLDTTAAQAGGLSGGLIALIATLAVVALAALVAVAFLLGRSSRGHRGQAAPGSATGPAPSAIETKALTPGFCPNCGSSVNAGAAFCAGCGKPVES